MVQVPGSGQIHESGSQPAPLHAAEPNPELEPIRRVERKLQVDPRRIQVLLAQRLTTEWLPSRGDQAGGQTEITNSTSPTSAAREPWLLPRLS